LAHIGHDNKICTVADLKRKLQLELSASVATAVSTGIVTFTAEKFEADLLFLKFVIVATEYVSISYDFVHNYFRFRLIMQLF
jgi:hypothetical protein